MEIIPYFNKTNNKLEDGDVIKTLSWCCKYFNEKCIGYYTSINENGFHMCPYGFTSYNKKIGQTNVIYTSLVVSNHVNRKQVKLKLKNEEAVYKFSEKHFLDLVEKSILYNNKYFAYEDKERFLIQKINEINAENADHKNHIYNTLHDIRSLNKTLSSQSDDLLAVVKKYLKSDSENDYFKNNIHSILAISGFIATRLASIDILVNSATELNKSIMKSSGIYNKIFKCKQILSTFYKDTNVHFILSGESYSWARINDLFEICPYLILENYQKYSPKNTNVNINFYEDNDYIYIVIENEGPKHNEEEVKQIFNLGYRNKNIKNKPGNGVGLYIVKVIFDYLHFDIQAESDNKIARVILNVEYSIFRLKIRIPIDKKKNVGNVYE